MTLEVTTQHPDPDRGAELARGVRVWQAAQRIVNTRTITRTGVRVTFSREFTETVKGVDGAVHTPTDYFRYTITIADAASSETNATHVLSREFAFLMENQVVASLPEVREETEGAAPDELVVHYCDMIPFQRSRHDTSARLLRGDVPRFLHSELVPAMVEAFRIQSDVWGFTWHDAWTSYRVEEQPERLSVALTDGQT